MSFTKRAGLYVIRHKLKSLILLTVLTIIATFVLTGIAIQSSAKDAAKDVRGSVSGKIKLEIDMSSKNMKPGASTQYGSSYQYAGDIISKETLEALMKIPGVKDYNSAAANTFGGSAVDFKYIPGQFTISNDIALMVVTIFSEKYDGFMNGNITLKEGRHIVDTDNHVCMISNELAKYNNLSLGDTITIYSPDAKQNVSFTIVGIFTGTEGLGTNALLSGDIPGNQAIVDYNTLLDLFDDVLHGGYEYVDLYVEDPINIQNVYNEIANHPMIKGKTLRLSINSEEYNVIANPLESLQSLVGTLIIIVSAVSVAILALLLTIWIRGRVKETGILMSIGVAKPKIVGQFILETIFIAILAFGMAYPISNAIADKTGEFIMAQVVDSERLSGEDTQMSQSGVYDGSNADLLTGKPSAENAIQKINVTITPDYLLWVYVLGTLLIVCAVLIASYTVIRLKPREILSKMS